MIKIEPLKRTINVNCIKILGKVGFQEDRPLEIVLLRHIRKNGNEISLENIIDGLFFGRPEGMVKKFINTCQSHLGLIEFNEHTNYCRLTEAGEEALAKEEVLVPKYGIWELYWTEDPLFSDNPILKIEPAKESLLFKDINPKETERPEKEFIEIPDIVKNCTSIITLYANESYCKSKLGLLEPKVEMMKKEISLNAIVRLTNDMNTALSLSGSIEMNKVNIGCNDMSLSFEDGLKEMLESEGLLIHFENGKLKRKFEQVSPAGRKSFEDEVRIERPGLEGFGYFEPVHIIDIPVKPFDDIEAQQWFEFLIEDGIKNYIRKAEFIKLCNTCRLQFEEQYSIDIPSIEDFTNMMKELKKISKYWFLQTPITLHSANFIDN